MVCIIGFVYPTRLSVFESLDYVVTEVQSQAQPRALNGNVVNASHIPMSSDDIVRNIGHRITTTEISQQYLIYRLQQLP
jgi:hypothetical protein